MSNDSVGEVGDGNGFDDPFTGAPQGNSMTAPPRSDLKISKKRNSIGGGHRASSFGFSRNRAPSTSATSDFANGVAGVSSIGNTSPIVENDEMELDFEREASRSPLGRRSLRTPLEPIFNDLKIFERNGRPLVRPPQPVFGSSVGPTAQPERQANSEREHSDNGSFESFSQWSSSPRTRSQNSSFDANQGRPAQPAFGSFQSDASTSFSAFGQASLHGGRPSMDGIGSVRSMITDLTSPSPFGSLKSDKPAFGALLAEPKWTHEEDRFLMEMFDKYTSHGLNAPISIGRSGAIPGAVVATVTRNAIALWNMKNLEKWEAAATNTLQTQPELADWAKCGGSMKWVANVARSKWRHDKKATGRRLCQLVSNAADGLDDQEREQAACTESASENLTSMFSSSIPASSGAGSSIPLGSMTSPSSSARPVDKSMPPPPIPVRGEARNVERQIQMGTRTSVAPSLLPRSFRDPGASPTEIGRIVKSLRGVPGAPESSLLSGDVGLESRQSQSLSAATGARALGSALTVGPPLATAKGKKRSHEESVYPPVVGRNADDFDMANPADDVFGVFSLSDDRSQNGKRQNRSRRHTLLSSNGANASGSGRNVAGFNARGLTFNSGSVSSSQSSNSGSRGSNHAPSSSMPASLSAAHPTADTRRPGLAAAAPRSIAEISREISRERRLHPPCAIPVELATGDLTSYLPRPRAQPTRERRKLDLKHLRDTGAQEYEPTIHPETQRDIRDGGLLPGMVESELHLLAGIDAAEDFHAPSHYAAVRAQREADEVLRAQTPAERRARVADMLAENEAIVAAFNADRIEQSSIPLDRPYSSGGVGGFNGI